MPSENRVIDDLADDGAQEPEQTTARVGRRALVRGSLALGAALALAALQTGPATADGGALDPAPDPRAAQLEQDFLMGMVPHHRSATMMAEMAQMKASRPELRQLAGAIIEAQTREIAEMTHLLRDWYGMEPPAGTMMAPEMMDMMRMMLRGLMPDMEARMMALQAKSGAAFDIEFMSAMTDHHGMAVMMAAPVLISGHHAYLYTLAENIVISQGEEIKQMDEWLDAWYKVERAL